MTKETEAAMDAMDRDIARTDKWAFREFTGRWPTKADRAGASR